MSSWMAGWKQFCRQVCEKWGLYLGADVEERGQKRPVDEEGHQRRASIQSMPKEMWHPRTEEWQVKERGLMIQTDNQGLAEVINGRAELMDAEHYE
eukprot:838685-Lingulodinium_polyedra.AAC.1